MSSSTARRVLLEMVNDKIVSIKSKSRRNKFFFQFFTAGSILLGSAITLTLGFDFTDHIPDQKNIALSLGLLLTLLNSWMAVFDYKKLWLRQKVTLFGLYQLENELKFLSDTDQDHPKVEALFKTYQSIWQKDGEEWLSIYSSPLEEAK